MIVLSVFSPEEFLGLPRDGNETGEWAIILVVRRLAMLHVFPVRANAGAIVKVTDDTFWFLGIPRMNCHGACSLQ